MPKTMKLTDVGSTEEKVQQYIENPEWVMQQKFDGTRVMATYRADTGHIHWSNDGVKSLTHAAAKLKVPALDLILHSVLSEISGKLGSDEVSLDGELLIRTGEFVVWDILTPDRLDASWEVRFIDLQLFFDRLAAWAPGQDLVKQTPTAFTAIQKRELWERVNATNVEGAVSKHRESTYQPGVRSKVWLKHKLVKTADLVVVGTKRVFKPGSQVVKEGSAKLAVYNGVILEDIVSASLIGKDLTIDIGDVVEVAYLYREPGAGGLVQPRIIRKRWDAASGQGDKRPEDCGYDQFPEYSREVVSLEAEAQAV